MSLSRTEIKKIKQLHNRKGRITRQLFMAEGIRLLEDAVRFNVLPVQIYYSSGELSQRGEKLLQKLKNKSIPIKEISQKDIESISETETPQGIIGIFEQITTDPNKLWQDDIRRILICDSISDPGNLGTLIRSALAFEFSMVIATGTTTEIYSPKAVRSTMGAIFGIKVGYLESEKLIEWLKEKSFFIVATSIEGDSLSITTNILNKRIALAIGSEADGLSDMVMKNANYSIAIKHTDKIESLNASVAGSILMREIFEIGRKK